MTPESNVAANPAAILVKRTRKLIAFLVCQSLVAGPLTGAFLQYAPMPAMAASAGTTPPVTCYAPGADNQDITSLDYEFGDDEREEEDDEVEGAEKLVSGTGSAISIAEAKQDPFFAATFNEEKFIAYAKANGGYTIDGNTWYFCGTDALDGWLDPISSAPARKLLSDLETAGNRIAFKNQLDRYALTGEPCRKFVGDVCDTTMKREPVYLTNPTTGEPELHNGEPIQQVNPDTGEPLYREVPLYFDDTVWPNGRWDAPKADIRVLETLIYLVTPTKLGGAGREHIKVGKIIQTSQSKAEFQGPDSAELAGLNAEDDSASAIGLRGECGPAHYYDATNPERPACVSQAFDLVEIDNMRITTKITQKRRIGGNKTTWQFKSFPIKVAWQTDAGIDASGGLPALTDMFSSAKLSITNSFLSLLAEYDFGVDIDPSKTEINNLSDLAGALGQSLLAQLLNSPNGSLSGWNFESTLEGLGRAYLASQLGLVPGALADTDGDVIENIGRATLEHNLGLPAGSLKAATGDAAFKAIGQRYLEETVIGITTGSLDGTENAGITERLKRIGQGRMEKKLSLQPGSLRTVTSYAALVSRTGLRGKALFSQANAAGLEEDLGLTFINAGNNRDRFGNSQDDYRDATERMIGGSLSVEKYFVLVGASTVSAGIGSFSVKTAAPRLDGSNIFGSDPGTIYTSLASNDYSGLIALLASGGLSSAEANDLRGRLEAAKDEFGYAGSDTKQIMSLYNKLAEPNTGWLSVFSKIKGKLAGSDGTCKASQPGACDTVNRAITQITSYQSSLLSVLRQQQQSGQGAALNLSGVDVSFKPDGTISDVKVGKDPMLAFLSGESMDFASIGRQVLGSKVGTDGVTKVSLGIQLAPDGSVTFNPLSGLVSSEGKLEPLGLKEGDLQRIFQKGLASEVFKRVGTQELLRTALNQTDIPKTISQSSSNASVASYIATASKISKDYAFYHDRYEKLKTLSKEIDGLVDKLEPAIREAAKKENAPIKDKKTPETTKGVTDNASESQVRLKNIKKIVSAAKDEGGPTLAAKLQEAQHVANEIIAGRQLSLTETPIGTPSIGSSSSPTFSGCWNRSTITQLIKGDKTVIGQDLNGDGLRDGNEKADSERRQKQFTETAKTVGACQFDTSLGLPSGSMKGWADTKDYTYDSLAKSVGRADATANKKGAISDSEALAKGKSILTKQAAALLPNLIPGFSQALGTVGLTGEDLVSLLTGGSKSVLKKIGTNSLDKTLSWKPGTASSLIDPTCYQVNGTEQSVRPCTSKERESIRLNSLARLGMQEIGLGLQLPTSFDVTGQGGILTSFGRSFVSESLGLATNSFTGTYEQVREANAPAKLVASFGVRQTPFMQEAVRLRGVATSQAGSKTYQEAVAAFDLYLAASHTSLLDAIGDANNPYWQASTAENALKLIEGDRRAFQQLMAQLPVSLIGMLDAAALENLTIVPTYQANISLFQSGIAAMNKQFGGDFKQFLTGGATAESITKDTGKSQLTQKLKESAVNALLDAMPEEVAAVVKTLFTPHQMTDDFRETCTPYQMFTSTSGLCSLGNLSDLVTGKDEQSQKFRGMLYDNFLAQAFGAKLTSITGIPSDAVRGIIMNPAKASQIAISHGMVQVAATIFTAGTGDDYWDRTERALKTAFLAAFEKEASCDKTDASQLKRLNKNGSTTCYRYELDFDADRGLDNLKRLLGEERIKLTSLEGDGGKGVSISINELNRLIGGELEIASDLATQQFVSLINANLNKTGDSRAAAFKIDYVDAIQAQRPLTKEELEAIAKEAADKTRGELAETPNEYDDETKLEIINQSAALAVETANKTAKAEAQKKLQYQVYDVLAFQADQNIPLGFSKTMLTGTSSERNMMVGSYAFNSLGIAQKIGGITLEEATTLYDLQRNKFNDDVLCADRNLNDEDCKKLKSSLGSVIFPKLEAFVTDQLGGLGLPNLPKGTILGFAAWAKTGFDSKSFDAEKLSFGGQEVASLGKVLKDFGEAQLFMWSDKMLGFNAGESYQIYKATTAFTSAVKAFAAAEPGSAAQAAAYTKVSEAAAQVFTLLANAVFDKQFAALDESLGLVAGTTSGLVGAGISYLFGVGNPLTTLGILVAINLFGCSKTVVTVRGGANGVYPLNPPSSKKPAEYPSPEIDGIIPEFNAKKTASYRNGVRQAAQAKVNDVLRDLLMMPSQWGAAKNTDPNSLWISQVFTHPAGDLPSLDHWVSSNAPWDNPPGTGYGSLLQRTTGESTMSDGMMIYTPVEGYHAGFFPDDNFWNHIHVRW